MEVKNIRSFKEGKYLRGFYLDYGGIAEYELPAYSGIYMVLLGGEDDADWTGIDMRYN